MSKIAAKSPELASKRLQQTPTTATNKGEPAAAGSDGSRAVEDFRRAHDLPEQ